MNNHFFDFYTEVSKGLVPKHTAVNKFGFNLDIDTGTDPETIWSAGGKYVFASSANRILVSSSSSSDDLSGQGASKIKVFGVDEDYNLIEEEIGLRGTGQSVSQKSFLRVFRAFVTEAGTEEANVGTILIEPTDRSLVFAVIPATVGQTQMAVYTVPANHKAYITNLSGAIVRTFFSRQASIGLYFRKNGIIRLQQEIALDSNSTATYNKTYTLPLAVEEKTDIYVNAIEVSGNDTGIFSNFGLILVDQSVKYK